MAILKVQNKYVSYNVLESSWTTDVVGLVFCFGFCLFVAFKSKRVKKTSVCYAETFKETYRYEEYNSSTDISLLTETPYSR